MSRPVGDFRRRGMGPERAPAAWTVTSARVAAKARGCYRTDGEKEIVHGLVVCLDMGFLPDFLPNEADST
jgi:hypothetical protein